MAFLALAAGLRAQESLSSGIPRLGSFSPEGYLLDYDTALSVRCSYDAIDILVHPSPHIAPRQDGNIVMYSNTYRTGKHECVGDSLRAQEVYLARLERLHNPDLRHKRPSPEVEKIICNFELLTGIRNTSGDGDSLGPLYISSQALDGWKVWFNAHKTELRFCPTTRVIFLVK